MSIAVAIVVWIWGLGSFNLWRLQNRSRTIVTVTLRDRLFSLTWLPLSLYFISISLPYLTMDLMRRRRKIGRRGGTARREQHVPLRLVPTYAEAIPGDQPKALTARRQLPPQLRVASDGSMPADKIFTIRSPITRRR